MNSKKSQPGISVLIGIIIVGLLVTFSIGLGLLVVDSIRQSSDVKQSTIAYYQAEGALEHALMVNNLLRANDQSLGAEVTANTITGSTENSSFKLEGSLIESEKIASQAIIPFPWTGNAPWHGEGSLIEGGCDPKKKPPLTTDQNNFLYKDPYAATAPTDITASVLDHPCNWNTIKIGEKVSIPLYGINTAGAPSNFTNFTLRVRTPCKPNSAGLPVEMCSYNPPQRMQLNCFDKGKDEQLCLPPPTDTTSIHNSKGEVILLWQIDSINNNESISLLPMRSVTTIGSKKYQSTDSQIYEGKINKFLIDTTTPFAVLTQAAQAYLPSTPIGSSPDTQISTFLINTSNSKPTLKLSLVTDLITCTDPLNCNASADSPTTTNPKKFPYLEYQISFGTQSLSTLKLPSSSNQITAEGSSGNFNHIINVSVPHDSSSLEYVIQQ